MHHVVVLVGSYGTHWRHLPLVARCGPTIVLFVDHRHTPQERQDALRSVIPLEQMASWEATVTDAPPGGCDEGYHLWQPADAPLATRCLCLRCPRVDTLAVPFPTAARATVRAG